MYRYKHDKQIKNQYEVTFKWLSVAISSVHGLLIFDQLSGYAPLWVMPRYDTSIMLIMHIC